MAYSKVPELSAVITPLYLGAGWLDPKASTTVDYEGNAPTGTMTYDDAMNRTIAVDDPLFGQTVNGVTYTGINCPSLGANATSCIVYELDQIDGGQGSDQNYYATTKAIDANNHVTETFADMLGNTRYVQVDSGDNGNTLTPAKITATQYNVLNEATSVIVTDEQPQSGETTQSVTTSMSYDDLGRLTTLVDPDRGTHNYSYDNDGHLIEDSSGSRTLGYNYDLLGRLGCEETAAPTANATGSCSAGTPLIQNTYDTDALGTKGSTDFPVGRLTKTQATTIYPDGTQSTSTESMQYDLRGRIITQQLALSLPSGWNLSTALPVYQLSQGYNDANQPTSTQTSTIANGQSTPGYTFTDVYDGTSGENTGALVGLSNNLGATSNVASLLLNENALPGNLTYYTSAGSGSIDATEQFSYDGDLRPQTDTATWGAGSGQSGQIFSESRWYDFAGNVVSLATTQAAVPGQSGSGGSETENYCYNEQDELVWASNASNPSPTSTETCGSQTPGNSLNGASYTTSYVYTNLGQLWQGPVAGGVTTEQYLYCNTAPHQLSGLYALGSTCANKSGAVYKDSSYDAWGNVTGRTYGTTSETLAYDELDRMVKASLGSGNNDYFAYDASGNRTVQRATSSNTTTITVYAFGLEEYQYSGTGTLQNATHYYNLGKRLIGALTGLSSPSTVFYLTDALGNLTATFSNTQGAAAIQGNQVFGPYGNNLYSAGQMDTARGYTGQYTDALTGLSYYVSRYYDSVAGVFLSADTKEGNAQGMNPYAYVDGNPETMNDPTGHDGQTDPAIYVMQWYMQLEGTTGILIDNPPPGFPHNPAVEISNAWVPSWDGSKNGLVTTMVTMQNLIASGGNPRGNGFADIMNTNLHLIYEVKGGQSLPGGGTTFPSTYTIAFGWAQARWYAAMANQDPRWNQGAPWTAGNNTVDTRLNAVCPVACMETMDDGRRILIMNTGYGVLSYWVLPNMNTSNAPAPSYWAQWFRKYSTYLAGIAAATVLAGTAGIYGTGGSSGSSGSGWAGAGGTCSFSANTVVWTPRGEVPIGQLQVDEQVLAYNPLTHAMQAQPILEVFEHTDADLVDVTILPTVQPTVLSSSTAEVLHTTRRHPLLTVEEGFIPVSQLRIGMHVIRANGSVGIVTAIRSVAGSMVMYNLDVAQDHTFVVGDDQWIVHNKCFDGVA